MYEHERSLVKRLEGKPFALIGVNSDTNRKELKVVLKKEKISVRPPGVSAKPERVRTCSTEPVFA